MQRKTKLEAVKKATPETHSLIALTFDAEIKRIAIEKGREIGEIMTKLAGFTGLDERQIYNYRSGKSDIPSLLIPVFCKQFESNALAMAVLSLCEAENSPDADGFDIARFCTTTVREMLECGADFLDAFDDGKIDGHEMAKLKNTRAKIIRSANRLLEIAQASRGHRVTV